MERVRWRLARGLALAVALSCLIPTVAAACILNNQGSLSANGTIVENSFATTPNGGAAPITFSFPVVYGRGAAIRFTENFADLRKSLTPAALSHPFLWVWGDRTYSRARTPSHTYAHTGTYLIRVFSLGQSEGETWSPFDRATIRVVPPGEVWRDNLGHTLLGIFDAAVSWTIWTVLGLIAVILAWGFWGDWRQRHRRRGRGAHVRHPA